ncbi:MAG TPA: serine hydrolase [Phycisphaerales bacterium]|nr:serine hydrolase [Phycisphaerales bacterium]
MKTGRFVRCASFVGALGMLAGAAFAQPERYQTTQTAWWYYYGQTEAEVQSQWSSGKQIVGMDRNASTGEYDVVFVSDNGPFNVTGDVISYTQTSAQLAALKSSGKRFVDLEAFDVGGLSRFTVATIPDTGATGWDYTVGQTGWTGIETWQNANGLRIIDLEKYVVGGNTRYAAVAIPNTGTNAQGWWWYYGQTEAQVNALLATNGARLIDIEVDSPGTLVAPATFAVVMVSSNTGADWVDLSLSSTQVSALLAQTDGRLTCLERYTNFLGATTFAVALVDNADAQTRRMRDYMDNALTDGTYGFMLKEVGGPVITDLNENFAFEPASMLKILHATYAIDRCASNLDNLNNLIFIGDRTNNNECPDNVQSNPGNETLSAAIREMMQQSDNNRTWEIEKRYGTTNLNNYADITLGLTDTQINHRLGCLCGNPFNSFSCVDAVSLYEQIADGSLFAQNWQDTLYNLMLDLDEQGYASYPTLSNVINQEAANTDLTSSEIADFRDEMRFANKGGGYACNGTYYRTEGGWASVPFKVQLLGGWFIAPREYTLATFVHANNDSVESQVAYRAKEEILREQIRAALQSWDNACSTPTINNEPDAITNAQPGTNVQYSVGLAVGAGSRTYQWQYLPLGSVTWGNIANEVGEISGATTNTLTVININQTDEGRYRCVVSSICGSDTSLSAALTVANVCDSIDFNRNTVFPEDQDVIDFFNVLAGGPCPYLLPVGIPCDIDFNNNGVYPEDQDVIDFFNTLAGGTCP